MLQSQGSSGGAPRTAAEMSSMSVREIKDLLDSRDVMYADCIDKSDLIRRYFETDDV